MQNACLAFQHVQLNCAYHTILDNWLVSVCCRSTQCTLINSPGLNAEHFSRLPSCQLKYYFHIYSRISTGRLVKATTPSINTSKALLTKAQCRTLAQLNKCIVTHYIILAQGRSFTRSITTLSRFVDEPYTGGGAIIRCLEDSLAGNYLQYLGSQRWTTLNRRGRVEWND